MGRRPAADIEQNDQEGFLPIGKKGMLHALKSTLENAADGKIPVGDYHFKLVTADFPYQYGRLNDQNIFAVNDVKMLVDKLRKIFEDVEKGAINEDDYFFELIIPNFYYTSGNYHPWDQVETTLEALLQTHKSESGNIRLMQSNVAALVASNISSNLQVPPVPNFREAVNDRVGERRNNIYNWDAAALTEMVKKTLRGKVVKNCIHYKCTRSQTKHGKPFFDVLEKRSFRVNWSYPFMIQISLVLCVQALLVGALPVSTKDEQPVTLEVGTNGIIPFECRNEHQSAPKYYTVTFEGKDRPFCIDGDLDPEGLMAPDQFERFSVVYVENDNEMSIEINIATVSVEDQGTYVVMLIIQGKTPEYRLMKKAVSIFIPPGRAICFLKPSGAMAELHEVHCHSKPGIGNSTLSCFQNGEKIPYQQSDAGNSLQIVYRRIFWLMNMGIPVSCCAHDVKKINSIKQESCNQYRYPRIEPVNSPVSPPNEVPTKIASITKPLVLEEEKKKSFPEPAEPTEPSGCSRNFGWPPVVLSIMAFVAYGCTSFP